MKLGVFSVLFGEKSLAFVLDTVKEAGLHAVELGTGNYPGGQHVDLDRMLGDAGERRRLLDAVGERGLEISALSCHSNPLHPDAATCARFRAVGEKTIRLASLLGVETVIDFSGCPGDHDGAKHPNWVTCSWPPDFLEVLRWQWEKKTIPFWTERARLARDHGVRIAIEMHPGFVVYNTEGMLRLREAAGDTIGTNLDPSHLFWQGMDPITVVRTLKEAIFHVHAKDTRIDPFNTSRNGVLDVRSFGDALDRSWIFRTVGYGHGESFWRDFVSALRLVGYDGTISIEHEDSLMSVNEGFLRGAAFLRSIILTERPGAMWWA